MATVTPTRTTRNLEQDHSRIKSPLARLRKYIHGYVSLEGAAIVGLFLALWFWIGVILDYGVFKMTYLDWVQVLPWGLRLVVLLALIGAVLAILALKVATRLFTDFTDAAVALVLERRFPKLLGDRLITAVEMSDPVAAAAHGYSTDMLRETIHEAAERVNQVPVKEVFDWKRLIVRGVLFGILTLGLYLLVGTAFSAVRAVRGESPAAAGYGDLNDVSTIWVERNILLRNTIWPRRAHLEIIDYRDDLRIPRESTPPALRVRAWKYVVADLNAPEGWRLLTWTDLKTRPELAGDDVPDLPEHWQARSPEVGLTVDEADLKLAAFPLRATHPDSDQTGKWFIGSDSEESGWRQLKWKDLTKEKLGGLNVPGLPGDWDPKGRAAMIASGIGLLNRGGGPLAAMQRVIIGPKYVEMNVEEVEKQLAKADPKKTPNYEAIRMVFITLERLANIRETLDKVESKVADRSMRRTVRKLLVPSEVTLIYKGNRTTNTNSMTRIADNEYTGAFGELKETVWFTVVGEDYYTAPRTITVVDRPRLEKLESEEERPAYLYYRPARNPADGSALEIRGKRQLLAAAPLSVSGDTTSLEVPSGTSLTLSATFTKDIQNLVLIPEAKFAKDLKAQKPEKVDDERTFQVRVPDIRREQRFTLRFTDDDNVTADRKIIIIPKEDTSPRVTDFNPDEVIRRGKEGYLVAVGCRIPFRGRIRDDHGLARVRYACKVIPGDFLSEQKVRSLFGVGAISLFAPGPGTQLMTGVAYLTAPSRELSTAVGEEASVEQDYELPAFARTVNNHRLQDGRGEFLEMTTIESLLKEKKSEPYRKLLNDFTIVADRWTDNDEDSGNPRRWVRAEDQRSPLNCDLPLWKLLYKDKPLKDPDDTKAQKRYFIEVRVVCDDTFLEGDIDPKTKMPIPHRGASGETFTFVVVPENELLSKIAEEEETKYRDLQKAFKPLPDYSAHLRDISSNLSAGGVPAGELNAYVARCESLADTLKTSQQDVKGVYQTYERILRELRTNQLREDVITKVFTTIYQPLSRVSSENFDKTHTAVIELRKALDAPEQTPAARATAGKQKAVYANAQMLELVSELQKILNAMASLAEINELIKDLHRIETDEGQLEGLIGKIRRDAILRFLRQGKENKEEK